MYIKTCKLCKKEFETKAHNALYCPDCRKAVKNARRSKESTNSITERGVQARKALLEKAAVSSASTSQENSCKKEKHEDAKSDLIKMAEQNVLNRCREAAEWLNILKRVQFAGDTFFPNWSTDPVRDAWHDGMSKARNALYYRLAEIQAEAFMFAGIGGEEAEKYAREKFRERFSIDSMDDATRYEVLHLLDEYLDIPHCAKVKDEEEFRRQAEQRYRDTEKD